MKKILITVIVCIIVIALVVTGVILKNRNVDNTDTKIVSVNEVTRSVFYAPQYVAIANGYFEEEGIQIELTTGQGADKVMTAVVAGQCDIGFAGPEVAIYVYNEGKEDFCQVFAQLTKKDGSFLVSKTNDTNFKWTDLKGKTVIPGRKGGVPYMTLEYVLRKNGLDPSTDLVLDDSINFDLMAGAFAGGNADYVTLFEPTATMTQKAQKGYVVASVGEEAGEIPYTAYFAKKSYIEENSDIIQKFTNAIYKGQTWVKEHTATEIAEAIQSYFPDTELELLSNVIQNYIDIDVWNENPILTQEAFERLQTVMEEAGELKEKAPYNDVINNSYAENSINK
jgi:NitT/TauT family transport system substrate-binding protein